MPPCGDTESIEMRRDDRKDDERAGADAKMHQPVKGSALIPATNSGATVSVDFDSALPLYLANGSPTSPIDRIMPIGPNWPGLLLNWIVFLASLVAIRGISRRLIAETRRRAGRCPWCGHYRFGQTACPECGARPDGSSVSEGIVGKD
jgi:hypothetical protein